MWRVVECARVARDVLAAMLRKRVKWLLVTGVSECLKLSHQRIVCRELRVRGAGRRGRCKGLCFAWRTDLVGFRCVGFGRRWFEGEGRTGRSREIA